MQFMSGEYLDRSRIPGLSPLRPLRYARHPSPWSDDAFPMNEESPLRLDDESADPDEREIKLRRIVGLVVDAMKQTEVWKFAERKMGEDIARTRYGDRNWSELCDAAPEDDFDDDNLGDDDLWLADEEE